MSYPVFYLAIDPTGTSETRGNPAPLTFPFSSDAEIIAGDTLSTADVTATSVPGCPSLSFGTPSVNAGSSTVTVQVSIANNAQPGAVFTASCRCTTTRGNVITQFATVILTGTGVSPPGPPVSSSSFAQTQTLTTSLVAGNTAGTFYSLNGALNKTAGSGDSGTYDLVGINHSISVTGAGQSGTTFNLVGVQSIPNYSASGGSVNVSVRGGYFSAIATAGNGENINGIIGVYGFGTLNSGGGTASTVAGFIGGPTVGASATVTNGYGLWIDGAEIGSGGSFVNLYGVNISPMTPSSPGVHGTVTNNYGLVIGDQTIGSSVNYAIKTGKGLVSLGDSVVIGLGGLSTSAISGFLYVPTCAGAPTGVPVTQTGTVAMIYDTTDNRLYVYNGGWKSAPFS